MAKIKFWTLTLLAAILVLIGLLTPAWVHISSGGLAGIWSWGLYFETNYTESILIMYNSVKYLIPGLIVTLLQLVALVMLIILAILMWKENANVTKTRIISLISAILLIFGSIAFIMGAALLVDGWLDTNSVGPGLILPLISAVLSIITAFLAKKKLS